MSMHAKREHGGELLTVQAGSLANWVGRQFHLLQNSNCDVHAPFQRSTHFRRSQPGASSSASASSAGRGPSSSPDPSSAAAEWTPRVVSLDVSEGIDSVLATYGVQEGAGAGGAQERALRDYRRQQQQQQQASASSGNGASSRPLHWRDLGGSALLPFHAKSLYPVPGLYEGTSDFHSFDAGQDCMAREQVAEDVLDRVRWFLEECDRPDGIHVLVEANSGWSGVGATLLAQLRDEYERMPIFCISVQSPPPQSKTVGGSFAASTPLAQSMLNSSRLLAAAVENATAVLPLTTHYWPPAGTHASASAVSSDNGSPLPFLADIVSAEVLSALAAGEPLETSSLLALQLHWATAAYRLHPRADSMSTFLGALTSQSSASANILAARWMGGQALETYLAREDRRDTSRESSSDAAQHLAPLHSHNAAVPLSLLGHWHAYPAPRPMQRNALNDASPEPAAAVGSGSYTLGTRACDRNNALTESLHVFGATEAMSHMEARGQFSDAQPPAQWRSVTGTLRLNRPTSFPQSFAPLLTEPSATSLYRCGGTGMELRRLGTWLASLGRSTLIGSAYAQRGDGDDGDDEGDFEEHEPDETDPTPHLLLSAVTRDRRDRQKGMGTRSAQTQEKSEDLHLQLTNQQIEELAECGATLQNLAESY